jgi:PGF-CTERM protein
MRTDALLAGVAVAALLATVALATLVPGFVGDPAPDRDAPPARLDVSETTLSVGEVTGETATLDVTAYLSHRGGPADNVSVVVRATDAESGLVVDSTRTELGSVEAESEHEAPASVTVPREGSYEVTTLLYVDGQRVDAARASVSGVSALTPPYAESNVEFHGFPYQPPVEYTIQSSDANSVTLDVTSYLTNGGDAPESDLRLVVTARQSDSNVIAARTEANVGAIEPGRTARPNVELRVPEGYNYYLDVTLWRDGVILESTRAVANLDPEETLTANETRREVAFEASDFETTDGSERPPDRPGATESGESQPGFGPVVALLAVVSALFAARRWSA